VQFDVTKSPKDWQAEIGRLSDNRVPVIRKDFGPALFCAENEANRLQYPRNDAPPSF